MVTAFESSTCVAATPVDSEFDRSHGGADAATGVPLMNSRRAVLAVLQTVPAPNSEVPTSCENDYLSSRILLDRTGSVRGFVDILAILVQAPGTRAMRLRRLSSPVAEAVTMEQLGTAARSRAVTARAGVSRSLVSGTNRGRRWR